MSAKKTLEDSGRLFIATRTKAVGVSDIPRAHKAIKRTIDTLKSTQFVQDPLFDCGRSFLLSVCNSAVKRDGFIIEAAIKDAVERTPHLRLVEKQIIDKRRLDIQFEYRGVSFIALELKRGSLHDSTKQRQFRSDIQNIPALLRKEMPSCSEAHFHVVFASGKPPIPEGLTLGDLSELYGLHAQAYVETARQIYSMQIESILRERGL